MGQISNYIICLKSDYPKLKEKLEEYSSVSLQGFSGDLAVLDVFFFKYSLAVDIVQKSHIPCAFVSQYWCGKYVPVRVRVYIYYYDQYSNLMETLDITGTGDTVLEEYILPKVSLYINPETREHSYRYQLMEVVNNAV